MSSDYKTFPVNNQRVIVTQAIVITILIHFGLLFLFAYAPPSGSSNNVRTQHISFVNLSDSGNYNNRKFSNWIEYHDPSLVALPNVSFGYNRLNEAESVRPAMEDISEHPSTEPSIKRPGFDTYKPLPLYKTPATDNVNRFVMYKTTPLFFNTDEKDFKAEEDSDFPEILKGNAALALKLPESLADKADKVAQKPTVIKFFWSDKDFLPRFDILVSCGDRNLDTDAAVSLLKEINKISPDKKIAIVTIIWKKGD
ncbi:hypothetical protein P0136_01430 [Lentisphaerota bacterium ZTH]|nr:hypothetical protein JYG24_07430 [Lentisphaerota bacterium]WET06676.1 hypothetical protein P0136_01430 [Lentisphaerota bacterium ZTH]